MDVSFRLKMIITIFFVFMTILIMCLLSSDSSRGIHSNRRITAISTRQSDPSGGKLEQLLITSTMDSRTVIITMVDRSWTGPGSVLDLFLESFQIGNGTRPLLNHLVVAALDGQAFEYCNSVHPRCFYHRTTGSRNQKRNQLLLQVLKFGFNLVYTEADVMWLRNPLQLFQYSADISIACNPTSDARRESEGLFYMLSSEQPIATLQLWNLEKFLHPDLHNRTLCHFIWRYDLAGSLNVLTSSVKEIYYGEFCDPTRDMSQIYTLQANCCENLEAKVHDLNLVLDISRNTDTLEMGKKLGQRLSSSGEARCFTR